MKIPGILFAAFFGLTLCQAKALPTTIRQPGVLNVRAFGAKGDGKTLDTAAIQAALDACGKAGGGGVELPSGIYLSQPVFLRNRTTLQLDASAVLKATDEASDFRNPKKSGSFLAFVNGHKLTDIAITGQGAIDGSGACWWGPAREAKTKGKENPGYTLPRPWLIVLTECNGVHIEGVTLRDSPCFHLVPVDCENVVVSNVIIQAPADSPNTDAIDPSSCKNVLITQCRLDVGDDNVAIKSGHKVAGRQFASENITVSDCTFLHGHGMSIGSETGAGVKNLLVENCTFDGTTSGIRIKSSRQKGGLVENLVYRNLTMTNVEIPINISGYYPKNPPTDSAQPVTATTPFYCDIRICSVTATGPRSAGWIIGLPESCVSNVALENVRLSTRTGLTIRNARNIHFINSRIPVKTGEALLLENAQVTGWANPQK